MKGVVVQGSRPRNLAFLHIPKTGGTFLGQLESDGVPVIRPIRYLGHVTVLDPNANLELDLAKPYLPENTIDRASLADLDVFSNVRNLYAFFVSYLHHSGGFNPKYRDLNHYDYGAANKGFEYLLKTIANRETLWPSRRFIHHMLFAQPTGEFLPVWLNNVGELNQDLEVMARTYNLKYSERARQRSNDIADYRSYYREDLVDLVNSTWAREISVFGFEFERMSAWAGREKVLSRLKGSKYHWRADLFIEG